MPVVLICFNCNSSCAGTVIVSPVMLRRSATFLSGVNANSALPSAWAGITMPTSGICRVPSGRGSWATTTISSNSSTAVLTAQPVRRARLSAQMATRERNSRVSR
ncbi:MAG: hypothetical protein JWR78_911 [Mycobacterium sp.]|nr:hypothetical protein [Mycobacterium sp.]